MAYDAAAFTEREYDGPMDESTEGAAIVHYRDAGNVLRRVTVTYFGEMGRRVLDYRLFDDANYALIEQTYTYARPIDPATPTHAAPPDTAAVQVCGDEVIEMPGRTSTRLLEELKSAEEFLRAQKSL